MSTASVEVLDMLSRQIIDIDEAVRLLKAIKKSAGRPPGAIMPLSDINGSEALMEIFSAAPRSQFCTGNLLTR
jgi:hypothetical protein